MEDSEVNSSLDTIEYIQKARNSDDSPGKSFHES